MDISISIKSKQNDSAFEAAKKRISDIAKVEPQWEKHKIYDYYETECDVPEDEILSAFEELITEYPELDILAAYSVDIREDDTSAQWWRSTHIKTVHNPDGTASLDISSSTQWF